METMSVQREHSTYLNVIEQQSLIELLMLPFRPEFIFSGYRLKVCTPPHRNGGAKDVGRLCEKGNDLYIWLYTYDTLSIYCLDLPL